MSNTLHEAASAGDLDAVLALLPLYDIDGLDTDERTPLMRAVAKGHLSVVQ